MTFFKIRKIKFNKRILYFVIIFLFTSIKINAQNITNIDSFKKKLINNEINKDTNYVKTILKIAKYYSHRVPDTALIYYKKALQLSKNKNYIKYIAVSYNKMGILYFYRAEYEKSANYYNLAIENYKKIKDKKNIAKVIKNLAVIHTLKSENNLALKLYDESLKIYKEINDSYGMAKIYTNISVLYFNLSIYNKSLEYCQKALEIFDKTNDKYGSIIIYGNMGDVFIAQKNYKKALEFYSKSLKLSNEINDKRQIAKQLSSFGLIYNKLSDYKKALEYSKKSYMYYNELGDIIGKAESSLNIGSAYINLLEYKKAKKHLEKSAQLYKEGESKDGEAEVYLKLASLYKKNNQNRKAIIYAKKSIELSKKVKNIIIQRDADVLLSDIYENLKQYKKSLEYRKVSVKLNDSIFNIEKSKAITEMETRYETEKKEKQILEQKNKLEISNLKFEKEKEKKEKQLFINKLLIISLTVVLFLIFVAFSNYLQRKKAFKLLKIQKHNLDDANKELEQTNEELQSSLEILNNQKKIINDSKIKIEIAHKNITDNIKYAKAIQQTLLTKKEIINKYFSEYFILFKPKFNVSGDFYYVYKHNDTIFFAVGDCTGHGVAGGFLTVLGITFLHGIISQQDIYKPDLILNKLRDKLKNTFKTFGTKSSNGVDIAICSLNTKTNILKYSGAFNPLWLIRDNNLIEYKATRNPIGFFYKEIDFKCQEIQLYKNDKLYLFSDGFADQVNEKTNKKFLNSRFKRMLLEINELPMNEQEKKILEEHEKWKGSFEQIDDITVMGVKI